MTGVLRESQGPVPPPSRLWAPGVPPSRADCQSMAILRFGRNCTSATDVRLTVLVLGSGQNCTSAHQRGTEWRGWGFPQEGSKTTSPLEHKMASHFNLSFEVPACRSTAPGGRQDLRSRSKAVGFFKEIQRLCPDESPLGVWNSVLLLGQSLHCLWITTYAGVVNLTGPSWNLENVPDDKGGNHPLHVMLESPPRVSCG